MCIVLVAWRIRPDAPLVLAANRDEYHERATLAAGWWPDTPQIYGGRDRLHGGSWLAVDGAGRMAAVTNLREPGSSRPGARSRGLLVSDFLRGAAAPADYLRAVAGAIPDYDTFNLLVGDADGLWFLSSRDPAPLALGAGIYGISNGDLDCPWPKVVRGKAVLQQVLSKGFVQDQVSMEELFALLCSRDVPPDDALPDTGVGLEWERRLAPLFVQAGAYGTRSSTLLFRLAAGSVHFHERTFDATGRAVADVHDVIGP
ncbi:MAG: NRDE family protein [Gammaproteobacteria bacterium]|nr:NRDE family protein [Gammaproteobacteria bacterium]